MKSTSTNASQSRAKMAGCVPTAWTSMSASVRKVSFSETFMNLQENVTIMRLIEASKDHKHVSYLISIPMTFRPYTCIYV